MHKSFCRVFLCALFSLTTVAQTPPLAITNVTVIDATGKAPQPAMTVLIANGRITKLVRTNRAKLPANTQIVDGSGKFLIPGLWDMHIHLVNQPNQELSRDWSLPLLVAYGVVGVRDMGGDWQMMQQLRQDIASGKTTGPRIVAPGAFIDGPVLSKSLSILPMKHGNRYAN
ncbi:MAG: hypothetical protein JNM09_11465 [Blastocatellia bacterium]|nr:hypothetical protein [Blastocatellia bacterium]